MFAGPNGSGKSVLKSYLPEPLLGVYLNADEMEAANPELRTKNHEPTTARMQSRPPVIHHSRSHGLRSLRSLAAIRLGTWIGPLCLSAVSVVNAFSTRMESGMKRMTTN